MSRFFLGFETQKLGKIRSNRDGWQVCYHNYLTLGVSGVEDDNTSEFEPSASIFDTTFVGYRPSVWICLQTSNLPLANQ